MLNPDRLYTLVWWVPFGGGTVYRKACVYNYRKINSIHQLILLPGHPSTQAKGNVQSSWVN